MPSSVSPRLRVLLIENDPMVRLTITFMLQDHHDIVQAASAESALAQLAACHLRAIGVVILDCRLPPQDIAEVLAAADDGRFPVLLISGDPTQAYTVDVSRPFLAKPFTQAALLSALDIARR